MAGGAMVPLRSRVPVASASGKMRAVIRVSNESNKNDAPGVTRLDAMARCSNENHIVRVQSTARQTLAAWTMIVAREYSSECFRTNIVERKEKNTRNTPLTPFHRKAWGGRV